VSALLALADRLEARHEKAKAQVDRLTPSILAKAFGGELVATEAAQAKAEGRSYETAAELLAHIKAHQSTSKPAPTTKKVGVTAKR
jgi:type I restriction enzyme S subunit